MPPLLHNLPALLRFDTSDSILILTVCIILRNTCFCICCPGYYCWCCRSCWKTWLWYSLARLHQTAWEDALILDSTSSLSPRLVYSLKPSGTCFQLSLPLCYSTVVSELACHFICLSLWLCSPLPSDCAPFPNFLLIHGTVATLPASSHTLGRSGSLSTHLPCHLHVAAVPTICPSVGTQVLICIRACVLTMGQAWLSSSYMDPTSFHQTPAPPWHSLACPSAVYSIILQAFIVIYIFLSSASCCVS